MFKRSSPALRGLPKISYAEFYDAFTREFRLAEYEMRQHKGARLGISKPARISPVADNG